MAFGSGTHQPKPRIGVTGNHKRWSPSWFAIRWSILAAGGQPVRLSIHHEADPATLDGMVISGGDDIHPSLYGGESMPKADYDRPRDELEQNMIQIALDNQLPMLGICRGHQLINVVLGGTLHNDIRKMRQNTSNFGTILPRKTALLENGSLLAKLSDGVRLRINSLHHQAVDEVGRGLVVAARDLDDFVQATECVDRRIISVQWHPEYLFYQAKHKSLFRWLVGAAAHSLSGSLES